MACQRGWRRPQCRHRPRESRSHDARGSPWRTFRAASRLERGTAIVKGRNTRATVAGRNVGHAIDFEDMDSDCGTADRHGKSCRQADAEHRRCGRGGSPAGGLLAGKLYMPCPREGGRCVAAGEGKQDADDETTSRHGRLRQNKAAVDVRRSIGRGLRPHARRRRRAARHSSFSRPLFGLVARAVARRHPRRSRAERPRWVAAGSGHRA